MPEDLPAERTGRHVETRFDRYLDSYAHRTSYLTASEIRALFAVASRPEVVSLAGGMPNIAGLPMDVVGSAIGEVLATDGTKAMQYSSGQGEPRIREQICDIMRLEGIEANPDDVTITVGSQQAVDLVTRIFCDPGDVILCEAPSYVGALGVFKAAECNVVHVEMDDDGVVPETLATAIETVRARGQRIKFFYTIPNFHNPAGISLSAERRAQVLEICRKADVLILEDNPYGLLGFDSAPYRALRADDHDNVIYLGSFSKTFAPGFRIGWVLAPYAVREKLVLSQESATLCPPVFSQYAISGYLDRHDWQGQIKAFREMYAERRDAMLTALEEYMPPGTTWTHPKGGFYVWLTLPEGLDAKAMLPRAVTARVAYVPGTAFYADGYGSRCMRLSYCYPTPERITEGIRRLATVINGDLDLRRTFGGLTEDSHRRRQFDTPGPELA